MKLINPLKFTNSSKLFAVLAALILSSGTTNAQNLCNGRTYTQGGWGAPYGNTATNYMATNFNAAFPNGIVLGCNNQLVLTSTTAIVNFLPSGGTATTLPTGTLSNPSVYSNVLAGQLVALMLNVGFDAYDSNFSPANMSLGNYTITTGVFSGMSVNNFITLASAAIGGCSSNYSLSDFNTTATNLNENYDNGTTNKNFVTCSNCDLAGSYSAGNILCNGGTTTINVGATGGSGIYNGTGAFQVSAGSYSYVVTDSKGCADTLNVNITEPSILSATVLSGNILCNGGTTTVTVNASGGTAPYAGNTTYTSVGAGTHAYGVYDINGCSVNTYVQISEPTLLIANISAGNILCNGGTTTVAISGDGGTLPYSGDVVYNAISAGTHSYLLTDANGCNASASITISEPSQLVAIANAGNILCHGGTTSVVVSVNGGTSPYTGNTTYNNVYAGAHTYSVSDANGCNTEAVINISEPELLIASSTAGNILCYGGSTTLTVSANGGTSPYTGTGTYTISAGTVSTTVTDANGCTANTSVLITQPAMLTLNLATSNATCYGGQGSSTANVSGGTTPYAFTWSPNSGQTNNVAQLSVGSYTVLVQDANACGISGAVNISLNSCAGFKTITQGGWGATCSGNNWGCYLNSNFAAAFPNGLKIGAGTKVLKLTTPAAIDAFLPSSTTARALNTGTMVNPGTSYKNILAGQAVALSLNITFDNYYSNFSSSNSSLGSLIISSGTFAGWSVNNLLNEANNVLGGLSSAFNATQLNDVLNTINTNYDNGTQNLNALACVCPSSSREELGVSGQNEGSFNSDLMSTNGVSVLESFPNPFNTTTSLHFKTSQAGYVSFKVFAMNGSLVQSIYNGESDNNQDYYFNFNANNLSQGIYLMVLTTEQGTVSKKIVLDK